MKPFNLGPVIKDAVDQRYVNQKPWPMYGGGLLDRRTVVTASEVGKCARRIKFGKAPAGKGNGKHAIPNWGFFERGHHVEAWLVQALMDGLMNTGDTLMFSGDGQLSFAEDLQSCTPDGLIWTTNFDWWYLEVKSFDPRISKHKIPMREHEDQLTQGIDVVQAIWTREEKGFVRGGSLVYVNASDYSDIRVYHYMAHKLHDKMDSLQLRSHEIMDAEGPADLPPEGMYTDDGCKYCEHTEACSAIVEKATKNGERHPSDPLIGVDDLLEEARKATENVKFGQS